MTPKKLPPIDGVFSTLEAMMRVALGGEGNPNRTEGNVFRTEESDWVVDTCIAFDTQEWETGIYPPKSDDCQIVEQYDSKEQAKQGHEKWVSLMRENPKRELPDIHIF